MSRISKYDYGMCIFDGCSREARYKGTRLCSSHHMKTKRSVPIVSQCLECGKDYSKVGRKSFCSDECRLTFTRVLKQSLVPEINPTHKDCKRCGKNKPHSEYGADKKRRDGLSPYCRECRTEYTGSKRREAARISKKEYDKQRRDKIKADPVAHTAQTLSNRNNWLVRKYGITLEGYDKLLESQGGVCAICKRSAEEVGLLTRGSKRYQLAVDHDHSCCPSNITCGSCLRELLCHYCNMGLGSFKDEPQLLREAASYIERHRSD